MSQNIHSTAPINGNTKAQPEENVIDVKNIISTVMRNWLLFVIGIVISFIFAYIYIHVATSMWHVNSKILVKDAKSGTESALSGSLTSSMGSLFNVKSSADNEIQILKSRSLMVNTVKQMNLNIRVFKKDGLKDVEIYNEAPFKVDIGYKADTVDQRLYEVELLNQNTFKITNKKDKVEKQGEFGKIVSLKQYNLVLHKIKPFKVLRNYSISVESPDASVEAFSKAFTAVLSDKQASTIDLALNYSNPEKGEAILDKIMQLYLLSNLQNEVQIADSTLKFINDRIAGVGSELTGIEKKLESYKRENNIVDISEQSKSLVNSASQYTDKLNQQNLQLNIIDDVEKFLNNPTNKKLIPSSLIAGNDLSFGQAINAYNELLISRDKALLSYTENNPVVINIDEQLESSRQTILKGLASYKKSLVVGRGQLVKQNNNFTGQLKQIPGKERNYLDFAREQNLKQELYLFLLQKREETAISKTSTLSSSRIIDPAKSDFWPFAPKSKFVYLIGFVLGLIIPGIILFVKELMNVRINSIGDAERLTRVPILGEIGHSKDKQSLVTSTNSRSVISEQFRSLRTSLQFVIDSSKSNVLLFTSSMSGEGKSFLSLNIGSALALSGKKVIFLELDLRKPKLSESIGLDINNGYTNYAISDDVNFNIDKIIKPVSFSENCFIISSGPIPPNPSELLMGSKLESLIDKLKQRFDYVLIDCAPIGLVTDALTIERFSNLTFYVIRQGFTYKSQINIINDLHLNNKVKNLYLIVNDVPAQQGNYGSYGQSYYGFDEEKNSNWMSKLKFWKK